jgi:lysophospholipase L1-like esterase
MSFLIAFSGIMWRLLTDSRLDTLWNNCQTKGARTPPHNARSTALALSILFLWTFAAQADFTIMPLGASVTEGLGNGDTLQFLPGGYRTRLYSDLHGAGYSFSFVGTQTTNPSPTLSQAGQTHHEGHSGYTITQIANNLDGDDNSGGNNRGFWFHKPAPPDIILLHIGGNEILQGFPTTTTAQRLDKLIGQIVADSSTSLLFVSSLQAFKDANMNRLAQAYNEQIRDVIVPKYADLGYNVRFVDQYSNFVDANGNAIHLGPDGRHPDQTGYDLMGDTWAAALQQAIPEPSSFLLLGLGGLLILLWLRHRTSTIAAPASQG